MKRFIITTFILALLVMVPAFGQVGQQYQNGTLLAEIEYCPEIDGERAVKVSAVSTDPDVVEYEVTLLVDVDGVVMPKRAVRPRPKERAMWMPAKAFYWSEEWRRVRYVALRANKGFCELCGSGPAPGKPLHVDHIKPRSRYPELELDPSNLQVLCADCNLGKSNTDEIDWRRTA